MTKLTLGIYPLGGATSPPVSKVSIPSKGCVVIDGYKLDGGQLAVDQAIVHPLDPAGTSAGYVSLKRLRQIVGENAGGVIFADSYEIAVQSAVADISAPPYAPGTHSYGDDELPAYPVWPDGEAEAPQEVTATADASEITDSQAEALEERIATCADRYSPALVDGWAKANSIPGGLVGASLDATDATQSEHLQRANNTHRWARSLIGAAWWAASMFESGADWPSGGFPEAGPFSAWNDLAEWLVSRLESQLADAKDALRFYWLETFADWSSLASGAYALEDDGSPTLMLSPPDTDAWTAWLTTHYAAAQQASVGEHEH